MSLSLRTVSLTPGDLLYSIILAITLCAISCAFVKILYRLTLHPLARYPGPILAASTDLYSGYYDIFKAGGVARKLPELHLKYGPVLRIAPDELHVFDFDSFNQ